VKSDDTIRAVLDRKGEIVFWISLDATVYRALSLMADHDVGALVVMERSQPVGILSERDYARKVILLGRSSMDTSVQEVMSSPVYVAPTDTVDSCLQRMTAMRVRHLVVVDNGRLVGVVSIGDLVNWMISAQTETIDHLNSYVAGRYPG
jgi:CBS domain-containing protein